MSALQARPKWRKAEENLIEGDVVLLVDGQVRRGGWKVGVIASTDGGEFVRTVGVRTTDGKIFERDRTKVVRLELDPSRVD